MMQNAKYNTYKPWLSRTTTEGREKEDRDFQLFAVNFTPLLRDAIKFRKKVLDAMESPEGESPALLFPDLDTPCVFFTHSIEKIVEKEISGSERAALHAGKIVRPRNFDGVYGGMSDAVMGNLLTRKYRVELLLTPKGAYWRAVATQGSKKILATTALFPYHQILTPRDKEEMGDLGDCVTSCIALTPDESIEESALEKELWGVCAEQQRLHTEWEQGALTSEQHKDIGNSVAYHVHLYRRMSKIGSTAFGQFLLSCASEVYDHVWDPDQFDEQGQPTTNIDRVLSELNLKHPLSRAILKMLVPAFVESSVTLSELELYLRHVLQILVARRLKMPFLSREVDIETDEELGRENSFYSVVDTALMYSLLTRMERMRSPGPKLKDGKVQTA